MPALFPEHDVIRIQATGFRHHTLALPVQHADQSEQSARGIEIDHDLPLEPFHQNSRTVIVNSAPAHIDRLDLVRGRSANRLIVTVADHVVVLHDPSERREREQVCDYGRVVFEPNIENQTIAVDAQVERVRSIVVPDWRKRVLLEKVVDCDLTLVLDVRIGSTDRFLIEDDGNKASLCGTGRWFRRAHFLFRRIVTE